MKKSILYSVIVFNLIFLTGCSSIKNMENPMKDDSKGPTINKSIESSESGKEVNLYFVRPTDILTLGQVVELYINNNEIGELTNNSHIETKVMSGVYEMSTKVGVSLNLLNISGFGGACKFSKDFRLTEQNYYYKVDYAPALLCGEHQIIKISKAEYKKLASN